MKDFETDLERNLLRLKKELETLTYEPRPMKTFVIKDPKTRVITAPHFRDRIVHHALCNIIEPIFDKTFIHDSYASRKWKGTHAALRRFDKFKREASSNGRLVKNAKDSNMVTGFVLKADIKHYFASVDHTILLQIIERKIRDRKTLQLIKKIISGYSNKPGKGMPIGSLTSQLFANAYLNGLDRFVKHTLKAKRYIRYMDDFLILHRSREKLLEWKNEINNFLRITKLELHPEKSRIFPLHTGVSFLGYRIFYHHKLLKKSSLRVIENRIQGFKEMYDRNDIPYGKIIQSLDSWMAYARYANTYNLRKKIFSSFSSPFKPSCADRFSSN